MLDLFRHLRIHTEETKRRTRRNGLSRDVSDGSWCNNRTTRKFQRKKKMNVITVNRILTWPRDHDIEEEFDHVDAHKMVTNLTCPNCATFVLVYTPKSHFEEGET